MYPKDLYILQQIYIYNECVDIAYLQLTFNRRRSKYIFREVESVLKLASWYVMDLKGKEEGESNEDFN